MTGQPYDAVIVGAGAAGLFTALSLAPLRVAVLCEQPPGGICASLWSQGGIAAAVGPDDTPASHAADTLKAGAGTADAQAAHMLAREAPRHIALLEQYGVRFEKDENGVYRLGREACHARRRVLRAAAGDGFGRELMRALAGAALAAPGITFVSGVSAEQVLRRDGPAAGPVAGVRARDPESGETLVFFAPAVVLATGGIGGLYACTTNPPGAAGRGIALAARAGAVLADLEFVQFHPTALDTGEDPAPLATEALRGEGALLVNDRGERFVDALAPRDIVSRAIDDQRRRGRDALLDCRHMDVSRFPAFSAACARAGLDPARDPVPVRPAAHYHMGGIATDLRGRASIPGLWAAGECASTGLHGANRLASNSLMEAVVMGARAARDIRESSPAAAPCALRPPSAIPFTRAPDGGHRKIRAVMDRHAGVVRNAAGLEKAVAALAELENTDDARLADMALVARMVALAALARTESRGGHFRADFPREMPQWRKRGFMTLKEADMLAARLAPLDGKREVVA